MSSDSCWVSAHLGHPDPARCISPGSCTLPRSGTLYLGVLAPQKHTLSGLQRPRLVGGQGSRDHREECRGAEGELPGTLEAQSWGPSLVSVPEGMSSGAPQPFA